MGGEEFTYDPVGDQFSLRFRLLMSYHDVGLREIAEATDSAVSTVGNWKHGRVPASRETLEKLAEFFHVSPEYLLTGKVGLAPASAEAAALMRTLDNLNHALESYGADAEARQPTVPFHDQEPTREQSLRLLRDRIEDYFRRFLDHAEREPGGLQHTWIQLRREFPLDLFDS